MSIDSLGRGASVTIDGRLIKDDKENSNPQKKNSYSERVIAVCSESLTNFSIGLLVYALGQGGSCLCSDDKSKEKLRTMAKSGLAAGAFLGVGGLAAVANDSLHPWTAPLNGFYKNYVVGPVVGGTVYLGSHALSYTTWAANSLYEQAIGFGKTSNLKEVEKKEGQLAIEIKDEIVKIKDQNEKPKEGSTNDVKPGSQKPPTKYYRWT